MSEWVSLREFARRQGVTLRAVQRAVSAGRIELHDVPGMRWRMLDLEEAREAWESTRVAQNNNRFGDLEADQEHAGEEDEGGSWGQRFTRARALKTEEEAVKLRLEREQLEGNLHAAEDIERVISSIFHAFRQRILKMPATLASRLTGMKDTAAIQNIIEEACREALSELARYDPQQIVSARRRRKGK